MLTMTSPAGATPAVPAAARGEAVHIHSTTAPPRDGAPGEHPLAPGALRYRNVVSAAGIVVITAVGVALVLLLAHDPAWRLGLLIALGAISLVSLATDLLWLNPIAVRSTSYTATGDFVYIARGRWIRRTVVIATSQILNVETTQGPLLRSMGLVKVSLTRITDGEAIAPLTPAAARALQDVVLAAQRADDDA